MKRKAKLAAFLLAIIMVISVTPISAEAAAPVKLSKSSVVLNITKDGKKTTYGTSTIKIKKSKGIKIQKTTYKSANNKIATVTKKGKVTAKKKGNTKITVTVKYKKGKKAYTKKLTYKVTVKNVTKKKTEETTTETSTTEDRRTEEATTENKTTGDKEPEKKPTENPSEEVVESLGDYSISGGETAYIYYMNSNENVCSNIQWKLLSGDKKAISGNDSGVDQFEGPWAYVIVNGNIKGDVVIGVYHNNTLLATATVHVSSSNPDFVAYEEWKAQKKQELWTSDMTDKDKVLVFARYSREERNYDNGNPFPHDCIFNHSVDVPYGYACEEHPMDCFAASVMIVDIADDLGLEAQYIGEGNLDNGETIGYDHPSKVNGHIMALVHFETGWETVEATPFSD